MKYINDRKETSAALSGHETMFIDGLKQNMMIIMIVAIVVSILFAMWNAKRISAPLVRISRYTKHLSNGDYDEALPLESDITEISSLIHSLKVLTSELGNQQTLRKRMTSDLSHELRTPLTNLQGNIEGMIDGIWEVTPDRLQSMEEEVQRLARLVNSIESLNKLEGEYFDLDLEQENLYSLTDTIVNQFKPQFVNENKQIELTGEDVISVFDKDKMIQVITNLISNSLKFTNEHGVTKVSVTKDEKHAILKIEDDGIGISQVDLPHIFERLYRADESRNAEVEGQGIGLSIVQGIIQAHGGQARVKSEVGNGTVFTVKIPLVK
jgi:signal transduction histidine kinase